MQDFSRPKTPNVHWSRFDELDGVVFHQKLGTVKDKAERVAALARELAPKVGADPDAAEQAARLAKCDLVTNMVVEFTSLQGKIGRLMYEREHRATPSDPTMKNDGPTSPAKAREEKGVHSSTASAGEVAGAKRRSEGDFSPEDHTDIAIAIEDHYKPQGPSDKVPTNPVAVAVALADKLDTLVGFWAIDEKPTGSKDPYALRRAALGVVRIILENGLSLGVQSIVTLHIQNSIQKSFSGNLSDAWLDHDGHESNKNLKNLVFQVSKSGFIAEIVNLPVKRIAEIATLHDKGYDDVPQDQEWLGRLLQVTEYQAKYGDDGIPWEEDRDARFSVAGWAASLSYDINYFILDRLKVHLRDQGIKHDHIDAVFALGGDDLVDITNRIKALGAFLSTDDGTNLLAGYKRAANILKAEAKKAGVPDVVSHKGTQPEETLLFDALETAGPLIETALASEDYAGAMTALAGLRSPIDTFFDEVKVNSDDENERDNRLGLLMQVRALAGTIADFDKVEG